VNPRTPVTDPVLFSENLADVPEKDRYKLVLAHPPPSAGKERKEVQQDFSIRTGETAFLFLKHFIMLLKAGGRGAVVIKNTFLSNSDNATVSLRKLLLESGELHTVLDRPSGPARYCMMRACFAIRDVQSHNGTIQAMSSRVHVLRLSKIGGWTL